MIIPSKQIIAKVLNLSGNRIRVAFAIMTISPLLKSDVKDAGMFHHVSQHTAGARLHNGVFMA